MHARIYCLEIALRRKYKVNDAKMKEILLEITEAHYSKSELSTNKDHPNDVVHVFKIQECIFRKNRALAPHERSAVPLGTDHCPVGLIKLLAFYTSIATWKV